MDFDTTVKLAVYNHIARTTRAPLPDEVAALVGAPADEVRAAYRRLYGKRVLVLHRDGESVRMAPPFSGIPTQHRVRVAGREYFANCAWDALGVIAALHQPGEVFSRCEQSLEPLYIRVGDEGPEPEPCVIHFAVPA